jgi:methionine synthase II (cobalamin-independent)
MIADNTDPADITFGELGYAREARISYQDFLAARELGQLPADVRFQVSLPTPFAVINPFISPKDAPQVEGPYADAMLREVDTISRAVPHRDLCVQWDVCIEMLLWDGRAEGMRNPFGANLQQEVMERMKRLGAAVPEDVELGFHLCYGDLDAKHFIEPLDAGKLVEIANGLTAAVHHPIAYIHMPVPINRHDYAYFKPLRDLKLSPRTELYLGLVHSDGVEATQKRIAAASKYVSDFGIATECGIARLRAPAQVRRLLEIHAGASREPAARAGTA